MATPKIDLRYLSVDEQDKMRRIYYMLKSRPVFEEATDDIGSQINFIRKHANPPVYYTNKYLFAHPLTVKKLYHSIRNDYVKAFRLNDKKYVNAEQVLYALIQKSLVVTA